MELEGVPLRLHRWIPDRNVRSMVWRYLNKHDREVLRCVHNGARRPRWTNGFSEHCARAGYSKLMRWSVEEGLSLEGDSVLCAAAAKSGAIEILKYAHALGAPWDEWTCASASIGGHLEVLEWARSNGAPWDGEVCARAAGHGHMNVLVWARAHGAPWDEHASK